MTEFIAEASDLDLADQAVPADDSADEIPDTDVTETDDANVADVIEQHQSVPSGDDDYQP